MGASETGVYLQVKATKRQPILLPGRNPFAIFVRDEKKDRFDRQKKATIFTQKLQEIISKTSRSIFEVLREPVWRFPEMGPPKTNARSFSHSMKASNTIFYYSTAFFNTMVYVQWYLKYPMVDFQLKRHPVFSSIRLVLFTVRLIHASRHGRRVRMLFRRAEEKFMRHTFCCARQLQTLGRQQPDGSARNC